MLEYCAVHKAVATSPELLIRPEETSKGQLLVLTGPGNCVEFWRYFFWWSGCVLLSCTELKFRHTDLQSSKGTPSKSKAILQKHGP